MVTAVCIPFLRKARDGWQIVWPDILSSAKIWRKGVAEHEKIPRSKELHGVKLASGRGNFLHGKHNFKRDQAARAYRGILANLGMFIPEHSIMSASASRGRFLYGYERLEKALYALFQRMGRQCTANDTNALVFFDQGHPEYRALYRKAQRYLPTGSKLGGWSDGSTKNLPLEMFTKDANEKNSKHCYFTQVADLVAYAAFLKIKAEAGELTDWQSAGGLDALYDQIPSELLNLKASYSNPRDGIVRLK